MQFGPRVTPVVKGLLIANTAVFVLQQILFVSSLAGLERFFILFGLAPDLVMTRGFIWQPITYMFLHGGVWHLALNMLMLWMFGSELETAWGSRKFLNYYLICGVGAAVTTAIFDFHSRSIGASGAVFGLLLAFGMLFPRRVILLWMIFPIQARYLVWLCAGIEFLSVINMQAASDGIAHWAHLGGMLFGWIYLKRGLRLGDAWSRMKWKRRRSRFRVLDSDDDDRDHDRDHDRDNGRDKWVH
jgi:membrane associated rhomboid family serine protease